MSFVCLLALCYLVGYSYAQEKKTRALPLSLSRSIAGVGWTIAYVLAVIEAAIIMFSSPKGFW